MSWELDNATHLRSNTLESSQATYFVSGPTRPNSRASVRVIFELNIGGKPNSKITI